MPSPLGANIADRQPPFRTLTGADGTDGSTASASWDVSVGTDARLLREDRTP
jgi:hypothetical protein